MRVKSLIGALALGASAALLQAGEAKIYLLGGQSNMKGMGKAAELTPETISSLSHGSILFKDTLTPMDKVKVKRFGPEVGFVKKLSELVPNQKIYIAKFAVNGTPLHHGWDKKFIGGEPAAGRTNFYPGESKDDPNKGSLYLKWIETYRALVAALKAQDIDAEVGGIVWMQGEKDASNEVSAKAYAESLKRLKRRIQEDTGSGGVPFVFGQVLPNKIMAERYKFRSECRQSMADADLRSGSDKAVPNMWMVPTEDMDLGKDNLHYNTQGQLKLGTAFAETIVNTYKNR